MTVNNDRTAQHDDKHRLIADDISAAYARVFYQ